MLGLFQSREESIYKQIILINRLRNEIAHRLKFENYLLEKLYDHHPETLEKYKNAKPETKDILILTNIISHICSYLLGKFTTQVKIENIIKEIVKKSS